MNKNISHRARLELVAALLLGGLFGLLTTLPARAAEPFRLDRLAIVRFSPTNDGRLLLRNGVLAVDGTIAWRASRALAWPANFQPWVLNRDLVDVDSWLSFHSLGGEATANFEIREGGVHVSVADQIYMVVAVSDSARRANGSMINLSTRTRLSDGETVVAGFVVEDRPRAVLIRAVGPSLTAFGVPNAHPDPVLTLLKDGTAIAANDNWSEQPNAGQIAAATNRVGAFPLQANGTDAAAYVIVPPGAYTVHVAGAVAGVHSRDVLVEVYTVPEDV